MIKDVPYIVVAQLVTKNEGTDDDCLLHVLTLPTLTPLFLERYDESWPWWSSFVFPGESSRRVGREHGSDWWRGQRKGWCDARVTVVNRNESPDIATVPWLVVAGVTSRKHFPLLCAASSARSSGFWDCIRVWSPDPDSFSTRVERNISNLVNWSQERGSHQANEQDTFSFFPSPFIIYWNIHQFTPVSSTSSFLKILTLFLESFVRELSSFFLEIRFPIQIHTHSCQSWMHLECSVFLQHSFPQLKMRRIKYSFVTQRNLMFPSEYILELREQVLEHWTGERERGEGLDRNKTWGSLNGIISGVRTTKNVFLTLIPFLFFFFST